MVMMLHLTTAVPIMETATTIKIPTRHEYKHRISQLEALVLSRRLGKVLRHDANVGTDGRYLVTSLYFDSPFDEAMQAKIAGISYREKFRIRYYGQKADFIKLEKKYKKRDLGAKDSVRLEAFDVQRIIAGDFTFLKESKEMLKREFYLHLVAGYRPKVIIRYEREAFTYLHGNVRITIDTKISSSFDTKNFLGDARFYMIEADPILEVKYDRFLPDNIRLLVNINQKSIAYSKYVKGRTS